MGGLFSRNKKGQSKISGQDKTILQLKEQRDKLKQYQKRVEQSLKTDRELARKCLDSGRKERAKLLLRKKKYQEKLLENTDVQLENLEKLASDIEYAQVEQEVLNGLKAGNEALKKVHDVLTINEIERILDETREGVEKQRELDEILTGALTKEDEDTVLAELDALVNGNNIIKDNKPPEKEMWEDLPEVPTELPEEERQKRNIKSKPEQTQIKIPVEM